MTRVIFYPPRIGWASARRPPARVRRLLCAAGWHYWPVSPAPGPAHVAVWESCGDCGQPVPAGLRARKAGRGATWQDWSRNAKDA